MVLNNLLKSLTTITLLSSNINFVSCDLNQWMLFYVGTCEGRGHETDTVICTAEAQDDIFGAFIDPAVGIYFTETSNIYSTKSYLYEYAHTDDNWESWEAMGNLTFNNADGSIHASLEYHYNDGDMEEIHDRDDSKVLEVARGEVTGGSGVWDGAGGKVTFDTQIENSNQEYYQSYVFGDIVYDTPPSAKKEIRRRRSLGKKKMGK